MVKTLRDKSMVEKREAGEHARPVVLQGPRDRVKAGLLEPQAPGMERHIHRHGMYGRCRRDGSVSFRGKLRSGQTPGYQKLYHAAEIRSRSAATG